jgi:hypothetical protein
VSSKYLFSVKHYLESRVAEGYLRDGITEEALKLDKVILNVQKRGGVEYEHGHQSR